MKRLYFCGGAFGSAYYIGVLKALQERKIRPKYVYGNSAGALFALVCLLEMPTDDIEELFNITIDNTVRKIRSNPLDVASYQLTEPNLRISEAISNKYPRAYKAANGRLHIGITKEMSGFAWKNTFASNRELFHTLLCSYNAPIICNYDAEIDGEKCVDGCIGFDMRRHLPKNCMTVGCCNSDCVLNGNVPVHHCFLPPPKAKYEQYVKQGYTDFPKNPSPTSNPIYHSGNTLPSDILIWLYRQQLKIDTVYNKNDLICS